MTMNQGRRRTFVRWLAIATLCGALPAVVLAQAAASPGRVAVASHDIARGVVLSHTDFGYVPSARAADRGAAVPGAAPTVVEPATASDSLVGWMTRRLIAAGEPLRSPAVVPPQLVKSGDVVDVVFQGDGVSVTMRGKATRSAAVGERLQVRMDNQRRIEGTVIAPGRVRVN